MSRTVFTTRPRVIGSNSAKYLNKEVTIIGEVTSITRQANTLQIRQPDDETMIVLLSRQSLDQNIELNLLTEVTGRLVSRGQLDASWVKQYDAKQTAVFNKQLYIDAANIMDAHRRQYDI